MLVYSYLFPVLNTGKYQHIFIYHIVTILECNRVAFKVNRNANQLNIHILMIYIKHIDYIIIYLPYEHYLFENRMKNLFIKIKMSHFFITFCDPCYSLFIAILKSQMTQFSYTYTDQFRIMRMVCYLIPNKICIL